MHLSIIWAIAPAINLAGAFKDTSPFFFFSTSEYALSHSNEPPAPLLIDSRLLVPAQPDIVSALSLSTAISPILAKCPSDDYLVISQANVHAADFASERSTPCLRQMISGDNTQIRSSVAVRDVVGNIEVDRLAEVLRTSCGTTTLRVNSHGTLCHLNLRSA